MSDALSPNTQAILLLTAPLVVASPTRARASSASNVAPLSDGEYGRLATHLRDLRQAPADLLSDRADEVVRGCGAIVPESRLRLLLERGFLLAQALERWQSRAIWVMSRADPSYPPRLKQRLGTAAPPILYGCGDPTLLSQRSLGLAGPSSVALVRLCADAAVVIVVSESAPAHAGPVVVVLAGHLERAAMQRDHRDALLANRLVLVSPRDPGVASDEIAPSIRATLVAALEDATLDVSTQAQPLDAAALRVLMSEGRSAIPNR